MDIFDLRLGTSYAATIYDSAFDNIKSQYTYIYIDIQLPAAIPATALGASLPGPENIIGLREGATIDFQRLVDAIGMVGVVGYANGGYWTVHLARVFLPDFGGIDVFMG